MRPMIRRFLKDESGATAIEYALIATLISVAAIGGFGRVGNAIGYLWGDNASRLQQGLR